MRCEGQSDLTGYMAINARRDTWYTRGFPIDGFYALARTWHDVGGPRNGCAFTHMLFLPLNVLGIVHDYSALFAYFRKPTRPNWEPYRQTVEIDFVPLMQVSDELPAGQRFLTNEEIAFWTNVPAPVVCKNDEITEDVAIHRWRRMTPEERQQTTFCTSAFGEVWRDKNRRYDFVGIAAPSKAHIGNFYHAHIAGLVK